jgi:hypothetical protein
MSANNALGEGWFHSSAAERATHVAVILRCEPSSASLEG